MARAVIEETAGICADYPDWPEWLRAVRGRSADERLRADRTVKTLLDSSVLIAHLRGEPGATSLLLSLTTEERLASVLSRTEIEGGMRARARASATRDAFSGFARSTAGSVSTAAAASPGLSRG